MKHIRTYHSFRENKNKLNEEFIGGLLKGLIPDWIKNINIKNRKGIDRALEEYKKEYEQANKDLSAILDSKGEIEKNKLSKIQSAIEKKRSLLLKELNDKISSLTKDNEKSKDYANLKRNAIEKKLIESELEEYKKGGLEENEYIKQLKENSKKAEENQKKSENKLKIKTAEKSKEDYTKEITKENITPGEIFLYMNSEGKRCIVKITEEGKIQRITNEVEKVEFEKENNKNDDQKNILGLFKKIKKFGDPFDEPYNDDYSRLKRISKEAENKFK